MPRSTSPEDETGAVRQAAATSRRRSPANDERLESVSRIDRRCEPGWRQRSRRTAPRPTSASSTRTIASPFRERAVPRSRARPPGVACRASGPRSLRSPRWRALPRRSSLRRRRTARRASTTIVERARQSCPAARPAKRCDAASDDRREPGARESRCPSGRVRASRRPDVLPRASRQRVAEILASALDVLLEGSHDVRLPGREVDGLAEDPCRDRTGSVPAPSARTLPGVPSLPADSRD